MSGDALTCLVLGLRWAAKVSQEGLNLLVQVQEMGRNLRQPAPVLGSWPDKTRIPTTKDTISAFSTWNQRVALPRRLLALPRRGNQQQMVSSHDADL